MKKECLELQRGQVTQRKTEEINIKKKGKRGLYKKQTET